MVVFMFGLQLVKSLRGEVFDDDDDEDEDHGNVASPPPPNPTLWSNVVLLVNPFLITMLTQSYLDYFHPVAGTGLWRWANAFVALALYAYVVITASEEDHEQWSQNWSSG